MARRLLTAGEEAIQKNIQKHDDLILVIASGGASCFLAVIFVILNNYLLQPLSATFKLP